MGAPEENPFRAEQRTNKLYPPTVWHQVRNQTLTSLMEGEFSHHCFHLANVWEVVFESPLTLRSLNQGESAGFVI